MQFFDASSLIQDNGKFLPVLFLLDASSSMADDNNIGTLNRCMRDMLDSLLELTEEDARIRVAAIQFSGNAASVVLPMMTVRQAKNQWRDLTADGMTPLGDALRLAKKILEDKSQIPSGCYRPTVVLVSDGAPNDQDWENRMDDFVTKGRSARCDRMALAIGADVANEQNLLRFLKGTLHNLYYAADAKKIADFFEMVTLSITKRSRSATPNAIPADS